MTRKVGSLERSNPLPPGQYWVDVFGKNIPTADAWFKAFSGLGVHVDATQTFDSEPVRNWYKFTYAAVPGIPVTWDTSLGYPTVADSRIQSSEDTVQWPDLELDPIDRLANWTNEVEQRLGGSLGSLGKVVPYAFIAGVGYLGYLLVSGSGTIRKVKSIGKRIRKSRS